MIKWIYKKIKLSFKLFILGILALAAFSFGVYAQNNHNFYENYGKNITMKLKDVASSCETYWEEFKAQHEENQKIKEQKEKDAQAEEEAKAKVAAAEKKVTDKIAAEKKEVADKIAAEKARKDKELTSICNTMYLNVVDINRRATQNNNSLLGFKYDFLNELDSKYVKEFSFNETKWKYSTMAGHEKFLMIIYSEEIIFYSIWIKHMNEFIHLGGVYTASTDTLTMKRNFLDEDFAKYTKLYHQLIHAFYDNSIVMPTTE